MSLLYDRVGSRKYLTVGERNAFLRAARGLPRKARTLCLVLAYTGARVSEALALTPAKVDLDSGVIVIESLKKRGTGLFRAVPVPTGVLDELNRIHRIQAKQRDARRANEPLWAWCRTTAWKLVKRAMVAAAISGPQSSPKGLRHAFAVAALQAGVPLNLVKKWLGHSRLSTTAIYADAVGEEEQLLAKRLWGTF